MRVNEFWLGMGPTLFKKQIGETLYAVKALPFGGAVVMEGEDEESEDERSFNKASIGRRALIIAAGAVMNFIIGFLIVLVLFLPTKQISVPIIDHFENGFQYEGPEMLMAGDELLKIDGYKIRLTSDVSTALAMAEDAPMDILVRRGGEKILLQDVPLQPDTFVVDGTEVYKYGFYFAVKDASFLDNVKLSWDTSVSYANLIWKSLGQLITGHVSVNDLSGPVGVTEILATSAKSSIREFFAWIAFISINLGVMNLLPLPALDGGRLLFIILEFFRGGKKVSPKYEGYVHAAGLVLLMGLMVYVTGHDILRLVTRISGGT